MTTTSTTPTTPTRTRTPVNTIGIAFGTAGLAGTWTAASALLGAPAAIGEVLWAVDAVAWVLITVRYLAGARGARAVAADLRHPVLAPFAALYPLVGSLLAAHFMPTLPVVATIGVWAMLFVTTGFGAWFVSTLLTAPRDASVLHGGYLLPTVAATLLTAQSLAVIGQRDLALGYFAVGILFWLLLGAVLLFRFVAGPALPNALLPTLAIFSAPPAVAGNAWWAMTDGEPSVVHGLLAGTMAALILPHVFLVRRYVRSASGIGMWALTFTAAASATYAVRLVMSAPDAGPFAPTSAWIAVLLATALVGAIALGSARLVFAGRS